MQHIEYLDIFQNQRDSIINEQIKPSSLHEINLNQENNNEVEEEYNYDIKSQLFTCKCEKAANQYDKSTHFSTNLVKPTTEEPSRWLLKQDSPLFEIKNYTEDNDNFSELLKKINDASEKRDKVHDEEKELNKINEVLKADNRKVRDKVYKMRVNELNPYHRDSKSHDFHLPCDEDTEGVCDFSQIYEKHASFDNNRCRMYENVSNNDISHINYVPITDNFIHENELRCLICQYTPSRNIPRSEMDEPTRTYENSFYNAYWNKENNKIANLDEQFTGASLEYWGNNSIGSVEHSLTQSEWNISKSSNEFIQHSFNQSNWLRSNTSNPNIKQRDLYA